MEARNGMNQAVVVTGLFFFCLAALLVPAFVMDWRLSRRPDPDQVVLPSERWPQPGPVGTVGHIPDPGSRIIEGMRSSLAAALRTIEDHRTVALECLDAARRVARAASAGFEGDGNSTLRQVFGDIEVSRRLIQNGEALEARSPLRAAIGLLDALGATPTVSWRPRPPSTSASEYAGATLVDASGRVIGEVAAIDAGAEEAVIRLGGWPDILGLVDVGGRSARIPVPDLIFGDPSLIHDTVVIAPFLEP